MIGGLAGAVAAAVWKLAFVALTPTGSAPGSTSTALTPDSVPVLVSAQICSPSASTATIGSVPPRVPDLASGVPGSGAASDAPTPDHLVQVPDSRTR